MRWGSESRARARPGRAWAWRCVSLSLSLSFLQRTGIQSHEIVSVTDSRFNAIDSVVTAATGGFLSCAIRKQGTPIRSQGLVSKRWFFLLAPPVLLPFSPVLIACAHERSKRAGPPEPHFRLRYAPGRRVIRFLGSASARLLFFCSSSVRLHHHV